ncbi:MAG: UvrB/UvrC motif-containing protein [Chlamydiales bacterium]|nr:UvrB/UvrC motif-containing protein [Chlamydiales bacterium]
MTERPVECGHCKKPAKVLYKEIEGKTTTCTEMCADCPILQQKLHGEVTPPKTAEGSTSGLCCGNCLTTLESVKTGNPVGCSECYSVFSDILVSQLMESDSIPSRLKKSLTMKRGQPLHVGKSPDKTVTIAASSRLLALNQALNDALKQENYEQAAWLRDQIKALTERSNDAKS